MNCLELTGSLFAGEFRVDSVRGSPSQVLLAFPWPFVLIPWLILPLALCGPDPKHWRREKARDALRG